MKSVLLVAWRNLGRRKMQGFLVAIVLALSVFLFFSGVGLMRELSGPFETMFEELEGSHYTLIFDSRIHDVSQVRDWWSRRPEVAVVGPALPIVRLAESAYVNGTEVSKPLFLTERPLEVVALDRLRAVAGSVDEPPSPGEIWIPTSIAQETDLEIGDVLDIPAATGLVPFVVTAVVVDPQFSAPFNSPTRVWIGSGELPRHFALSSLNQLILGVRLAEGTGTPELWSAFLASLGGHFNGDRFDYRSVLAGYSAPYNLIAMMLVVFSVFSVMIALLAVHGTVTSSILADFKVIGLLRAQGFRPLDVRRVFQLQYFGLSLVAVPVGLGLGVLAVRQGVGLLMRPTGADVGDSSLTSLSALTGVGFVMLVFIFVGRVARRAALIRPADAIRFGANYGHRTPSSGVSGAWLGIRRLGGLPVPLMIALKVLFSQPRRSVFLAISVLFATLTASLAAHLDYSFQKGREDLGLLGFDSADVRLTRGGKRLNIRHDRFMEEMNSRDDVVAIATWDYLEGTLLRGEGDPGANFVGTLLAGDSDGLGYRNLRGRNPRTAGEVSVGVTTASRERIDVGDEVELLILGRRFRCKVTGVYQTLNNGGTGFRVPLAAARLANPLFEPVQYGVVLADAIAPSEFIETIEAEYGEAVDAKPGDFFVRAIMDTVIWAMRVSNGFLAVIFLAAACVFIFNSTLMSIAENRKMYGIFKTVGMTPKELRNSVIWGVVLQATTGIMLGILGWWLAGGIGLSALFTSVGLVAFPLQNSLIRTLMVISVIFLFCVASGWIAASHLLRLDPKGLIVE